MKLLVIEDQQKTAAYLKKGLTEEGFTVDVARTAYWTIGGYIPANFRSAMFG